MSEIFMHVSSPYTISGPTLHRTMLLPLHWIWPRAWTVTSIVVVIIIIVVISITVKCMLGFVLTNYIVVDAMITAFETLLVIGCNSEITHVKE